MRSVPAVAFSIALWALAGGQSIAASDPMPAAPAPAATASPAPAGGASTADNEAAARHAKRTACINQARAKKLVGAQKSAYIKNCVGAP
jgi:hypothetical protein